MLSNLTTGTESDLWSEEEIQILKIFGVGVSDFDLKVCREIKTEPLQSEDISLDVEVNETLTDEHTNSTKVKSDTEEKTFIKKNDNYLDFSMIIQKYLVNNDTNEITADDSILPVETKPDIPVSMPTKDIEPEGGKLKQLEEELDKLVEPKTSDVKE